MDLTDYFNPVSLEKPNFSFLKEEYSFSRHIRIHTPDTPVKDIAGFDLAIFGIPEDQKAFVKGAAGAPDKIREKLYLLSYVNPSLKIADLGNLKITGDIEDSYYGLRDVLLELSEKNVLCIILGGSQDLSYGMALAYEKHKSHWNFTSLDSRLDFGYGKEMLSSRNYLDYVFRLRSASRLNYINIGHQIYFTPLKLIDKLENLGHESIKLGQVRTNPAICEPVFRDTDLLSVDMNCVRQPDAPGGSMSSPNGFFGHELCQLTRYAGASDNLKAIAFFNIIPSSDLNDLSSHLAAQAIWYFIEGYSIKVNEDPRAGGSKKYIVDGSTPSEQLVFYRSNKTDRWWIELPVKESDTGSNHIIACSYDDYLQACNNEIPDRWWRRMRKYS